MSADDIERIRELEAAATPGPWSAVTTGVRGGDHWYVCDEGESIAHISANDGINEDQRQPDAEFIAASRTAVPALLAAIDGRDRRIAALKAEILARRTPPHLDGNYREGIHAGLELAWRIVNEISDDDHPGLADDDPGPYTQSYPRRRIALGSNEEKQ